jgi:predicted component of type VI protein secretion system
MQHGQLAGLELHAHPTRAQGELQIPLESMLTMQNAEDIAACGLAPLVCQPNRDAAYALYMPTLRRAGAPRKRDEDNLVSLPYQLLAARVSALLSAQREQMVDAGSDEATAQRTQRVLDDLLADTGPGHTAQVTLTRDPDHRERRLLELELHTGRDVLNGATLHLTVAV